jgi:hypothetical protein
MEQDRADGAGMYGKGMLRRRPHQSSFFWGDEREAAAVSRELGLPRSFGEKLELS